jgi:hypothetical protein
MLVPPRREKKNTKALHIKYKNANLWWFGAKGTRSPRGLPRRHPLVAACPCRPTRAESRANVVRQPHPWSGECSIASAMTITSPACVVLAATASPSWIRTSRTCESYQMDTAGYACARRDRPVAPCFPEPCTLLPDTFADIFHLPCHTFAVHPKEGMDEEEARLWRRSASRSAPARCVAGLGEAAHAPERRWLLRDPEEAEVALAAGAL